MCIYISICSYSYGCILSRWKRAPYKCSIPLSKAKCLYLHVLLGVIEIIAIEVLFCRKKILDVAPYEKAFQIMPHTHRYTYTLTDRKGVEKKGIERKSYSDPLCPRYSIRVAFFHRCGFKSHIQLHILKCWCHCYSATNTSECVLDSFSINEWIHGKTKIFHKEWIKCANSESDGAKKWACCWTSTFNWRWDGTQTYKFRSNVN